ERKRLMFERSDAFVALPGGVGTLEELVEQLTWQQLGRHAKPILLANIDGFWEPLLALLAHMRATQFIRPNLQVDVLQAERIDVAGRSGAQANVDAAALLDLSHVGAEVDPEFGIGFAETDGGRARHQPRETKRRQRRLIEARRAFEVADGDGDVIDHGWLEP